MKPMTIPAEFYTSVPLLACALAHYMDEVGTRVDWLAMHACISQADIAAILDGIHIPSDGDLGVIADVLSTCSNGRFRQRTVFLALHASAMSSYYYQFEED